MLKKSLLALLPLALLAGGWYFVQLEKNKSKHVASTDAISVQSDTTTPESNASVTPSNPLATQKDDATLIVDSIQSDSTSIISPADSDQSTDLTLEPANTSTGSIDASAVAVEPLSDAEFIRLEQRIKTDAELRLSLLEEFRNNTDPARAKQLAALLGPYDDPEIFQIASELAYSGDTQSRIAGLDLLSRIQPRNPQAREIAIDLLSSGDSPEILVATMNVLATPPANASDGELQMLNDNLNNLSRHYDPAVRSQSMSLLGRWDKNSNTARDAFSRGLTDSDPKVRSSATFALNNIRDPDDEMISGLLSIAENTDENRSTRYAALRALNKVQLSGQQRRRYAVAKQSANRRN